MSEIKNDELLEKLMNPEERDSAFSLLVKQYGERLYLHIRRMVLIHEDADDILQEVFVKAYLGLDNFRGDAKLFTWLYRIASNEALNFLKKKKRKYMLSVLNYENVLINTLQSDPYFDGDEVAIRLQEAILKLPEKQRIVFNMRYYEEMPYNEMSEILETSEGALKASYHHAMKKIEKELNQ